MLEKYLFSCLVFSFFNIVVSIDISLDYYFGFDDPHLRSDRYIENCYSRATHETCQAECGPNHACLLGKCYCVHTKSPKKEIVLDVLLQKTYKNVNDREDPSSDRHNLLEESKSKESGQELTNLDEMEQRPSLRHHIAHFCPNLDIARQCIHKCMDLGKPAFCGKDHICYCGHRDGIPMQQAEKSITDLYAMYASVYEKYFGPRYKPLPLKKKPNAISKNPVSNVQSGSNEESDSSEESSSNEKPGSNEKTGTNEKTDSNNKTDFNEKTDPKEKTGPNEKIDSNGKTNSTETTDPNEKTGPNENTDSKDNTDSTETTDPNENTDSSNKTESNQPPDPIDNSGSTSDVSPTDDSSTVTSTVESAAPPPDEASTAASVDSETTVAN